MSEVWDTIVAKRAKSWSERHLKWRGHILKPHCDVCDVCARTVIDILEHNLRCTAEGQ